MSTKAEYRRLEARRIMLTVHEIGREQEWTISDHLDLARDFIFDMEKGREFVEYLKKVQTNENTMRELRKEKT